MEGDVLGRLDRLQRVADEIDRLEATRRKAQDERDREAEQLEKIRDSVSEKETRLRQIDMERRKRELSVKSEKDRLQRIKSRLGEVKTSREYQAVLAEISSAKQAAADQEEGLQRDLKDMQQVEAELGELRTALAAAEARLEEASARLAEVLGGSEQAVVDRRAEERTILGLLPLPVVDRYRLIRSRRGGLAVVEARDEACTACFMRIPPQMYIEVIRRSKVLECPNCHRILIPPREAEAEQEQ